MAYTPKTQKNNSDVEDFLNSISNEERKKDSFFILDFLRKHTGEEGKMWGNSIVGFGEFHYKTKSNCEGNWFKVGFSPRKDYLALYIVPYIEEQEELIKKIGKAKVGKSCINVKKIEDIDINIFKKLVLISIKKDMSNYGK